MEAHIIEWLNLSVRWIHIITGIAWIGASFYFIFLENSLNRTKNLREDLAGNLWAIHGGGFYYLEKYKLAPKTIPKDLHWFKYEAYFTWLSGITLLTIVYYYNAKLYMVDPNIAELTSLQAIGIGLFTIFGGWIIYDLLCKSPLVHKTKFFALLGFILTVALTYLLTQYISSKAAYIHIGAMLGTLMAANVFFVIIPSQKIMVASAKKGEAPNPELGANALRRSIHNNYMTLPVLFIMISNHFPSTFGNSMSWLILAVLILIGVMVRHWFNLKGKGIKNYWLLPASLLLLIGLVIFTAPKNIKNTEQSQINSLISDEALMSTIQVHCQSCHSKDPSSQVFVVAPKGLTLDTYDEVKANAILIQAQTVYTKIMPLGNTTKMTEEERQKLGDKLLSITNQAINND